MEPDQPMQNLSPELVKMVIEALDLAVNCFCSGDHNPFILYVNKSGDSHFIDVEDTEGNVDANLVEAAREIVSNIGKEGQRYVLAYDTYVTIDGVKTEAAIVEAAERGAPEAFRIVQRYRVRKRSKKPEKIGKPAIIGSTKQLLGAPTS
jgi:hypothetical protein